jgi:hypothetical protein
MKEGKTPVVSKGRVGNLKYARIAEVLFSDTFATVDTKFRYCQVFYDLVSRWGWIFPMHSKTEIGLAFATFCSQNWVPLILVRDGAGENVGGSLMKELLSRNVKSAFICPHHPQQNFAEGFIGRITAMASFGMVYSGAPLFMWIYSTKAANFVNNIAASYYSRVSVWATPYELVHNERFADSSIVVPFGCAALVLHTADERQKFHSRCALMIFLHYADDHPLFTYAFYSPKTKRIVHRQDVIFLTSVFPMRSARVASGLSGDGAALVTYRSPLSMRGDVPDELSFHDWSSMDPLPEYSDDVSDFELLPPAPLSADEVFPTAGTLDPVFPVQFPDHASFGAASVVPVPVRSMPDAQPLFPAPTSVFSPPEDSLKKTIRFSAPKTRFLGADQSPEVSSGEDVPVDGTICDFHDFSAFDQSDEFLSSDKILPAPIGSSENFLSDMNVSSDLTVGASGNSVSAGPGHPPRRPVN